MNFFGQLRQLASRVDRDLSQVKEKTERLLTAPKDATSSDAVILILLQHQKQLVDLQNDVGCLKGKVQKAEDFSTVLKVCSALVQERKTALDETLDHLSKYGYEREKEEEEEEEEEEVETLDCDVKHEEDLETPPVSVVDTLTLKRTPQMEDFGITQADLTRIKSWSIMKGAKPNPGSVTPCNSTWSHGSYPQPSPKPYNYAETAESDFTPSIMNKRSKKPAVMLEDSPASPELSSLKYSHRSRSKEEVSSDRKSPRGKKLRKGGGEEMASMAPRAAAAEKVSVSSSLSAAFASIKIPSETSSSAPQTPDLSGYSLTKKPHLSSAPAFPPASDTPKSPELTMRYDQPQIAIQRVCAEFTPLDLSQSSPCIPELNFQYTVLPPPAHCKPPPKALDLSMSPEVTGVVPLNWNQCDNKENHEPARESEFLHRPPSHQQSSSHQHLISGLSAAEHGTLPDYMQRLISAEAINRGIAKLNHNLSSGSLLHLEDVRRVMGMQASLFELVMTITGRLQKLQSQHGSSTAYKVL